MRTEKELIQIAIDNISLFKKYKSGGLCNYFHILYVYSILNRDEKIFLKDLINKHIKPKPSLLNRIICGIKPYHRLVEKHWFWEMYKLAPRLVYLKYLLTIYK